jgi:hypothetical protein
MEIRSQKSPAKHQQNVRKRAPSASLLLVRTYSDRMSKTPVGNSDRARAGFARSLFGTPRIWRGALWCAIGLAWFLLADFEGATAMRIVPGAAFLAIGITYCAVAVHDRTHKRGAYQTLTARRINEAESK